MIGQEQDGLSEQVLTMLAARIGDGVDTPDLDAMIGAIDHAAGIHEDDPRVRASVDYRFGIARRIGREATEPFIGRINRSRERKISYAVVDRWRALRSGDTASDVELSMITNMLATGVDHARVDGLRHELVPDLDRAVTAIDKAAGIAAERAPLDHRLWLARRIVMEGMPGYENRTVQNISEQIAAHECGPEHVRRVQQLIDDGYDVGPAVQEVARRAKARVATDGKPNPEVGFGASTWYNTGRAYFLKPRIKPRP